MLINRFEIFHLFFSLIKLTTLTIYSYLFDNFLYHFKTSPNSSALCRAAREVDFASCMVEKLRRQMCGKKRYLR